MSGKCKISDFGISKRTDDSSGGAFTAMQGTVFWMAPEVINTKKKGYNFKIDIWSVGCVVLEMWAGMRPWMGDEAVAVMFKVFSPVCFGMEDVLKYRISCTNPSSHLQYQRMSSCPTWRMTSDGSVSQCKVIYSTAALFWSSLPVTQRNGQPQQSFGSIRILSSHQAGCSMDLSRIDSILTTITTCTIFCSLRTAPWSIYLSRYHSCFAPPLLPWLLMPSVKSYDKTICVVI